jgi:putative oxygen-independent coproporphyrinogen III oxidase
LTGPAGRTPPLAVYVHWPYCRRICPYCDFNVRRDRGQAGQAALARAIVADLRGQAALTGPRTLTSVFFGGGTPSLMSPDWAAEILETSRRLWPPSPDLEVSLEANPTDAETGRFSAFAQAGVERLSLGVQSLDDAALAALGRNHDAAQARRAAEAAARAFPRRSVDLIYARPGQTVAAWTAELAQALTLGAEHISPYQLTIEAGTAFDRQVRRGWWRPPDADLAADLYEATQAVLGQAGFEAYEVSNHAASTAARSRHNLTYWRGLDYLGVGPGAHGRLSGVDGRLATIAHRSPGDYIRAVERAGDGLATREPLTPVEAAEERLLMGLRTLEGVAFAELSPLGLSPGHPRVTPLAEAGLIAADDQRIRATAAGRLLLDRVTGELAG